MLNRRQNLLSKFFEKTRTRATEKQRLKAALADRAEASLPLFRTKDRGWLSMFKFSPKVTVETMARLYPPKNIFYPLAKSPHPEIRAVARVAQEHSSCPVCLDQEDILPSTEWNDIARIPGGTSRLCAAPKSRLRPSFVCPDCGWPTHCSEEHYEQDKERHKLFCETLRNWSIDEHDMKSGRRNWEMSFPGRQMQESILNFKNWISIFVTRRFPKPITQHPVVQRHISRFLTYPYTTASLLYNPWTFYDQTDEEKQDESVITDAGWHLLSGLSHAVHVSTKSANDEWSKVRDNHRQVTFTYEPTSPIVNNDPFRIFVVGPRLECRLPVWLWEQLAYSFPGTPFRIYFIGPEAKPPSSDMSSGTNYNGVFKLNNHRSVYSTARIHRRRIPLSPPEEAVGQVEDGDPQDQPRHSSSDTAEKFINSLIIPGSVNLRLEYIAAPYEQVHESFGPFNRRRDIFMIFNGNVGHDSLTEQWKPALKKMMDTRCLMAFTSINEEHQEADWKSLEMNFGGHYVPVLRPTVNKFASMRPDIPVDCVHDEPQWVNCNWGLFAIHGVGSEVELRPEDYNVSQIPPEQFWPWRVKRD